MRYMKLYEEFTSIDVFILEKRISQISSNIEVTFGFDIIKTTHADDRSDFSKRGLGGNQNKISNSEISEFISYFKRDIAEGIACGDIVDQKQFVIRSLDKELSMAIVAEEVGKNYWRLIIKTLFRESDEHSLRTAVGQLIYEK
jgi:hypothetical protein